MQELYLLRLQNWGLSELLYVGGHINHIQLLAYEQVRFNTPYFSQKDINKWVDIFTERAEEKMYTLLQAAGEMFVRYARESGRYIDHTGNLRSSIGYVIVRNGSVAYRNFQKQNVGTEGSEGLQKAQKLARELATTHRQRISPYRSCWYGVRSIR